MNDEERRLGLDPSKYTKKPFNPQDSFGYSKAQGSNPLFKVVEDMRPSESYLEREQSKAMGFPTVGMSAQDMENNEAYRREKMQRMMGGESGSSVLDREYYARPESQEMIRRLNLDMDLERGVPTLLEDDEKRLESSGPGDDRTELLRKLMME